jgi:hypothetical protein
MYCALATAVVALGKSLVDLITAILRARPEPMNKRTGASKPFELVVRRIDERHGIRKEILFRLGRCGVQNHPGRRRRAGANAEEKVGLLRSK